MVGLEKILSCIEDEATMISNKIINDAELEAQNIILKARDKAELEAKLIIKEADDRADFLLKRADSQSNLKEREMILNAKREQINYILNESKKVLASLPDKEYFEVILKLCRKHISPLKGEMIFSQADLSRLPRDFKANLSELAKSIGGDIKISDQTREINGGFVLSYGDIEENCSFDALIESNMDALSDIINEILFS